VGHAPHSKRVRGESDPSHRTQLGGFGHNSCPIGADPLPVHLVPS
jgi:hypothetical protein